MAALLLALASAQTMLDAPGVSPGCANDGTWCRCGAKPNAAVKACLVPQGGGGDCERGLCAAEMACDCDGDQLCKMGGSRSRLECETGGSAPCKCGLKERSKSMFMLRAVDSWANVPLPGVECRWPSYFWS